MPVGLDVTVPLPEPVFVTVRVFGTTRSNLAVQVLFAGMLTVVTGLVPPHQEPLQLTKLEPDAGEAVRVTDSPSS